MKGPTVFHISKGSSKIVQRKKKEEKIRLLHFLYCFVLYEILQQVWCYYRLGSFFPQFKSDLKYRGSSNKFSHDYNTKCSVN